ncbi:MAG: Gfo/Idh/MocA family oxidoreductase [Victivallales bacterium]|nr:Gfo/Idh/MocA family oxidoreductase [Victivallales bacterium]
MVRLGIIGCGGRAKGVVGNLLKPGGESLKIVAVADPDDEAIAAIPEAWGNFERCADGVELSARPDVDVVMIFTPNAYHKQYIIAAMDNGKKVFSEKPLATTMEDCHEILKKQAETGCPLMTGLVLRYSPIYRKVKELLNSGRFGEIISISASENREAYGGGNSMSSTAGWRRFTEIAGPYILEKCSHDIDLFNWFIGDVPARVCGFGGLDYFVPKNQALWDELGHDVYALYVPEKKRINPFTSEKNMMDNHACVFEYPNGAKVLFQLTLASAIPERRMYIECTRGTIIVEAFSGTLTYRCYNEPVKTTLQFVGGGHGGGDAVMARELVDALCSGGDTSNISGVENCFDCARAALAADEAMRLNQYVDVPK